MKPVAIPRPFGSLLSLLPHFPHSILFAQGLNMMLKPLLQPEILRQLEGKLYCIRVLDAGMSFYFSITPAGFAARHRTSPPDLTISASAYDFFTLATRREDPDTLFFSRRLSLEGDTELGLLVKNSLDALELPFPEISALTPSGLANFLKSRLLSSLPRQGL